MFGPFNSIGRWVGPETVWMCWRETSNPGLFLYRLSCPGLWLPPPRPSKSLIHLQGLPRNQWTTQGTVIDDESDHRTTFRQLLHTRICRVCYSEIWYGRTGTIFSKALMKREYHPSLLTDQLNTELSLPLCLTSATHFHIKNTNHKCTIPVFLLPAKEQLQFWLDSCRFQFCDAVNTHT